MLAVLRAFELERGVRDGEVVARAFAQLVDDAVARGAVGLVCDGDVRRDGHEVRGHGGHVQVVHVEHPVDAQHVRAQLAHVHAGGGLLHEDRNGAAQERQRSRRHQDGDQERGDRVGAGQPEGPLCAGRDDDREGSERVVRDLQERGTHVEVRLAPAREYHQRHDVRDQADDADEEHGAGIDLGRGCQAPRALPGDHDADDEEHAGLQGGGQDLGARPPPRVLLVARAAHEACGDQRDNEAGGIHDHVPRVRRQRQGARPEGAEQLGHDDRPRDRERPPQALGRGPRVGVIVRVAALPAFRGMRVLVGVSHGLVDVGRGGGRFSRGSGAGGGEGTVVGHAPTVRAEGACGGEPRPSGMSQITAWVGSLGTGCPGLSVTDDVS